MTRIQMTDVGSGKKCVVALLLLLTLSGAAYGQGACCLIDGCIDTETEADCIAIGGIFLPGENCADGACGKGACCFEDDCATADAYSCIAAGREFAGAGTSCLDDPCDSGIGACCFADGACTDLSPEECDGEGGVWLGAGTDCRNNPCALGACCLSEDECVESTRHECDAMRGAFVQDAICDDDPCAEPLPECPEDVLFGQQRNEPDDFIAGTSEQDAGFRRFENFDSVTGPIERVVFWGLDLEHLGGNNFQECEESDPTFIIGFHEDAGGLPGAEVCAYTLLATRDPMGEFYLGAELNRYEVELPQQCVLVNGWISIVGLGDPDCWFLWMSADLFGFSYCEGCAPEEQDFDLALCLAGPTGGVLGACCVVATGQCTDDVDISECAEPGMRFTPGASCAELDPQCGVILGACCFPDATCDRVEEDDCIALGGSWLGANTLCEHCPCITPCPDDGRPEGEPTCFDDYDNLFNGGCSVERGGFSPISLGETICGESGVFLVGFDEMPDWDWYEIEVTEPTDLTWKVQAEFPPAIWILDGNDGCDAEILDEALAFECDVLSVAASVEPGTYWLVITPWLFVDSASCGAGYTATVGPEPIIGDIDGDGIVGGGDLILLLGAWGPCDDCAACPEDLDGDCTVGATDLIILLGNWG